MYDKVKSFFMTVQWHGLPMWVWFAFGGLLVAEDLIARSKFKSNSSIQVAGAALKLIAWAVGWFLMKFPPVAILVNLFKSLTGDKKDPPGGGMAAALVLVLALPFMSACGASTSTVTYQTGRATAQIGSASLDGFEQFDHDYQMKIVADGKKAGKTADAIAADLKAYRAKRPAVNKAFADFGATLLSGRALVPLVLSGVKKQTDLDAWAAKVAASWADVEKAIALLKGGGK